MFSMLFSPIFLVSKNPKIKKFYGMYLIIVRKFDNINEPCHEKTSILHMQKQRRESDQCLYFRYIDSTIPLLSKSEISSL